MNLVLLLTLAAALANAIAALEFQNGLGFIVRPTATVYKDSSVSTLPSKEQFFVYHQTTNTKVQSSFNPFHSKWNLTYGELDYEPDDPLHMSQTINIEGANISAHLVSSMIRYSSPSLQVLIHSDRRTPRELCAQVFVEHNSQERVSNYCFIPPVNKDPVCLVSVSVPYAWWSTGQVKVNYLVTNARECDSSNYIFSSSRNLRNRGYRVGLASLGFDDRDKYKDISEDRNILISMPEAPQVPGRDFQTTVKLHEGSELQTFVLSIRAGHGLIVKNCQPTDSSEWQLDQTRNGNTLTLTASVNRKSNKLSNQKVEDILECVVQVSQSVFMSEAELTWTISYESTAIGVMQYAEGGTVSNPGQKVVVTSVKIAKGDSTTNLVVIAKMRDMVGLKRFTGEIQSQSLWVYSISRNGQITQLNQRCNCSSNRPELLKVSKLCDQIYITGDDEDPGHVEISVRYIDIQSDLDLRVWLPSSNLQIRLADDRLNEVRGWKIPEETNEISVDNAAQCSNQYQSTKVQVFTHFYVVENRETIYMHNTGKTKVYTDITSLVTPLIVSSDPSIVAVDGDVLRGVSPGSTDIKVVSRQGRPLAFKPLEVKTRKVRMQQLYVNFVSSFDMTVIDVAGNPDLLEAVYSYDDSLTDKHREGVLDMWLEFDDDRYSKTSLNNFLPNTYELSVENQNPGILAVLDESQPIRVRAVGSGRGCLNIKLKTVASCHRKHGQLAATSICIDSKIEKPAGLFVNDAAHKSPGSKLRSDIQPRPRINLYNKEGKTLPNPNDAALKFDNLNVQQADEAGYTPLETGMFVVMGVLGIVATVFVTNCLVYVYRQQKASGTSTTGENASTEKVANGWIWLNRDVLEDNSVNTFPERFLPEREYQKRASRSDSLHSSKSTRSSTATYRGSECSIRITSNPRESFEAQRINLGLPENTDSELSESECEITEEGPMISVVSIDDESLASGSDLEEWAEPIEKPEGVNAHMTQQEFDRLRESVA